MAQKIKYGWRPQFFISVTNHKDFTDIYDFSFSTTHSTHSLPSVSCLIVWLKSYNSRTETSGFALVFCGLHGGLQGFYYFKPYGQVLEAPQRIPGVLYLFLVSTAPLSSSHLIFPQQSRSITPVTQWIIFVSLFSYTRNPR